MAWDNPHGTLSADERLRLEREAQIFAEAQRKMLREEQKRAEQEAKEAKETARRAESERRYQETSLRTERFPFQTSLKKQVEYYLQRDTPEIIHKRDIRFRVAWAKEKPFGSRDYLRGRYGQRVWEKKLKEVQDAQGCTRSEASAILVATYKEEDWRVYENDEVETLLGNRPE